MTNKKDYLAEVEIAANFSLESIAQELNRIIDGFEFNKDESGRYEEVPVFKAQNSKIIFILFGIPDSEISDAYILEMSCEEEIDLEEEARFTHSKIVSKIPRDVKISEKGYADISSYLAHYLNTYSNLCCVVAEI